MEPATETSLTQYLYIFTYRNSNRSTMATSAQAPWHAAYPAPRTTDPGALAKEDVLGMLQRDEQDFVLIDLRRNDHEVQLHLSLSPFPLRIA